MKIRSEKEKFSERLHLALAQAKLSHLKVSEIAIKFNLRHPVEPVTNQAVHKWLNGLAIPSADKIETLAKWLNISAQWLRYGISEEDQHQHLSELDNMLLARFLLLSEQQKKLILDIINNFK